ncbi:MAG TPA: YdcF family protein [Candidatus Saccharimonadales bacterium]|nr:YdcF family protein [Candidatus Saccharimonadales bacterium]
MKRAVVWLIVVAVGLGGLVIGLVFGIGYFLAPQSQLAHADAIVAISGGETDARAREAIKLYRDQYAPTLIFSGAAQDSSGPSNARAMERLAIEAGIEPDAIIIDEASSNTAQNAEAVASIAHNHAIHSIILVTSPYHQRRAAISFSRALGPDVKIINHSAPDQSWRRSRWWANPYAYGLTLSELQKTVFLMVTGSK